MNDTKNIEEVEQAAIHLGRAYYNFFVRPVYIKIFYGDGFAGLCG